jgi:post-segregation antitoxin (ccd killing protein)
MEPVHRQAVGLSIDRRTVEAAERLGIDMSEVAEAAIAAEVRRRGRVSLQERMDREMDFWNDLARQGPTVADEFGTT